MIPYVIQLSAHIFGMNRERVGMSVGSENRFSRIYGFDYTL